MKLFRRPTLGLFHNEMFQARPMDDSNQKAEFPAAD
jgi:hypothetical protein